MTTRDAPPTQPSPGGGWLWWAAGAIAFGAAGVAFLLLRRRARVVEDEPVVPSRPVPPPPAPLPHAPTTFTRLDLDLRPARAGLNLLSATVEATLTVTNRSGDAATDIRIGAVLLAAHAGQATDLAAAYAAPIGRPAAPAFALAPGESRTVPLVVALPRGAIRAMTAAGRPMFVPVVAVNCLYRAGSADAQATQSFAVGVERVDSAKLAPFWLDGPPRMYEQVAARRQG